jgi:hypothetical protein
VIHLIGENFIVVRVAATSKGVLRSHHLLQGETRQGRKSLSRNERKEDKREKGNEEEREVCFERGRVHGREAWERGREIKDALENTFIKTRGASRMNEYVKVA